MADLQDEWQENETVSTPSTAQNSQVRSQYSSGNWRNTYHRDRTTEVNRRRTDHGANRAFENSNRKLMHIPSTIVGRVIGKGGLKIRELMSNSQAHIKVENSTGPETRITLSGSSESIQKAEKLIGELVDIHCAQSKRDNNYLNKPAEESVNKKLSFLMINEEGYEVVDWDKLNAYNEAAEKERLEKLPPIVKDFYNEDPSVSSMSPDIVADWRHKNFDVQVKRTFADRPDLRPIPNPVLTFEQAFKDYPKILEEIYKQGFKQPSPIQSQSWPILLRGEDMIGIAQTGTGKTLAFLLPALIHIDGQKIPRKDREGPTVLILAPTRELALQIHKEVNKYQYKDIKSVCLYGGGDRKEQIITVAKGVDIVIATPGRLNDLILAHHLNIINFSYVVLDEADRMLDMGFEPQIRVSLNDVRPDRQTIMTSATWPPGVQRLVKKYMKDPIQVNVGSLDLAAVHTVTQKIIFVEDKDKESVLLNFIRNMGENEKVIIFCGKKAVASHVYSELSVKEIYCQLLHGNRDQIDREAALEEMVDGTANILVATDLASRGIDIEDITHVVNFDFPYHIEEYVHRVGRTGRAGKTGTALSFFTRDDWAHAGDLIRILREAKQDIPSELEEMAKRFTSMKIQRGRGRGHGQGRVRNYARRY